MIIINPLYFKPLYPNNYHLATAPRASSMRVMCTFSRKPALQRSTHSPRLQKRKPEAVLPAFPKLAGWWLRAVLPPQARLRSHTFCHWTMGNRFSEWVNRRQKLQWEETVIPTFLSSSSFPVHKRETVNDHCNSLTCHPECGSCWNSLRPPSPPRAQGEITLFAAS